MEITRREKLRWFLGSEVHRTTRGEPLNFERSPFLKPLYLDQSPRIVIKKCVQVGITEFLVCDALASADAGMRLFYILPKIEIRNVFVRDRVDRQLVSIPYYRARTSKGHQENVLDIDNVGLKAFGDNGVLLFVGSNSKSSFIAFPADKIIVDELDFCDQNNLELAEDRMKDSPYRHRIDVSTPTVEDSGIDRLYNESDRKRWFIRCEACNHKQEMDYFANVVRQVGDGEYDLLDTSWAETSDRDIRMFCKKCGRPINRLADGEWVAEFPGRDVSGRTISGMMSAGRTVRSLFKAHTDALRDYSKMQVFMNSDLGLAYTVAGQRLTSAILAECVKAGLNYTMASHAENTSAGVDVGQPLLHIQICDHPKAGYRRLVWAGTCRDFDELHMIFARFGTKWAVIDEKPETRKAREFQKAMKGRCQVWLCRYPGAPQSEPLRVNDEERILIADRTQTLDALVADIYNQALLLPINTESLVDGEYVAQLCSSVRTYNEEQGYYQWDEKGKKDHFFHAANYERIASAFVSHRPEVEESPRSDPFPHRGVINGLNRRRR